MANTHPKVYLMNVSGGGLLKQPVPKAYIYVTFERVGPRTNVGRTRPATASPPWRLTVFCGTAALGLHLRLTELAYGVSWLAISDRSFGYSAISMRRFAVRPSSVSFPARGLVSA